MQYVEKGVIKLALAYLKALALRWVVRWAIVDTEPSDKCGVFGLNLSLLLSLGRLCLLLVLTELIETGLEQEQSIGSTDQCNGLFRSTVV